MRNTGTPAVALALPVLHGPPVDDRLGGAGAGPSRRCHGVAAVEEHHDAQGDGRREGGHAENPPVQGHVAGADDDQADRQDDQEGNPSRLDVADHVGGHARHRSEGRDRHRPDVALTGLELVDARAQLRDVRLDVLETVVTVRALTRGEDLVVPADAVGQAEVVIERLLGLAARVVGRLRGGVGLRLGLVALAGEPLLDRKSTRLNSSH